MPLRPRKSSRVLLWSSIAEELRALVLVSGIPPSGVSASGANGDVFSKATAPGDVLDVRIEPAVFMDYQDARQRPDRFLGSAR